MQISKGLIDITMGWCGFGSLYLDTMGNRNWYVDGGTPYKKKKINPCRSMNPHIPTGDQVVITDMPGTHGSHWFGSNVHRFHQAFETHLVWIRGKEKGATYGGAEWGHSFTIKPEFYIGDSIDKYSVTRWRRIRNVPSPEFRRLVGAKLNVKP